MNTFVVEIRVGNGTASYSVDAPNEQAALRIAKIKLESCGLKGKLPSSIESFSRITKIK